MKADIAKLQAARELIARPGGWCQGEYARDANGDKVSSISSQAVCWCMMGALRSATNRFYSDERERVFIENVLGEAIPIWNDATGRSQADCIAAFDRAIELARSQEASS